jgi:hypothetical protein
VDSVTAVLFYLPSAINGVCAGSVTAGGHAERDHLPLEYRKASRRRAITDNLARIVGGGWHRQIKLVSLAEPGTVLRALKDIFIFWE